MVAWPGCVEEGSSIEAPRRRDLEKTAVGRHAARGADFIPVALQLQ
jgi:hypothetical protein